MAKRDRWITTVFKPNEIVSEALVSCDRGGAALDLLARAAQAGALVEWLDQLGQGKLSSLGLQQLERLCRILDRPPNDLLGYEADLQVAPANNV